jgi:AGCS family alanine or glycine:cation symporter
MLEIINSYLSGAIVPMLLIAAGLFYCFALRGFHLLRPMTVMRSLVSGERHSRLSSLRALTLALAGTLGVGNIVGVSSAIHLGGFGAVFWMWISALVAMILKYAEIVLAMKHKRADGDKNALGSAMCYIKHLFDSLHLKKVGSIVAAVFALLFLLTSLTMGSMLQSSAVAEAMEGVVGLPRVYVGAVIAAVTFFVIRSGTHSISALTGVLVPLMSVGYIVMSVAVIIKSDGSIKDVFGLIVSDAFSSSAAASGIGGFVFTRAVRYGVMRGLVSNEAGCGTAPTAHATSECSVAAKQGMLGIFEVFVDTVVLCSMTAFVVILNYGEASRFGGNYMMMTIAAYSTSLGKYASVFLCLAVLCFGFATILCWAHYGLVCAGYFGNSVGIAKLFTVVYCACVFVGAFADPALSWQLSDLCMGAMTVINLAVICALWREVKRETDGYLISLKK